MCAHPVHSRTPPISRHLLQPPGRAAHAPPCLADAGHAQAFDAFFEPELVKKLSEGPLTQLDQTLARSESIWAGRERSMRL